MDRRRKWPLRRIVDAVFYLLRCGLLGSTTTC
jgi:hypothetical protein